MRAVVNHSLEHWAPDCVHILRTGVRGREIQIFYRRGVDERIDSELENGVVSLDSDVTFDCALHPTERTPPTCECLCRNSSKRTGSHITPGGE